MTSSESEEQVPARKRSRRSNSGEDGGAGGKKTRGRPRVDTQDATAADRRRTQIRLAQRAYRQRKETTISSLKNQSSQLVSTIEQMNNTFGRLNDSAVKSGLLQLDPALAEEFKSVTETFANLVKTAGESYDDDEDCEGTEGKKETRKPAEPEPGRDVEVEAEGQHVDWGFSGTTNALPKVHSALCYLDDRRIFILQCCANVDRQDRMHQTLPIPESYFSHLGAAYSQRDSSGTGLVRRRQFTVGEVLGQTHRVLPPPEQPPHSSSQPPELPFGLVHLEEQAPFTSLNPHIYSVHIPTPDVTPPMTRLSTPLMQLPKLSTKTLPPITTYSFQETTFARHLARAALEAGFQLIGNAEARPMVVNHVFKLSLLYFNTEELHTRFRIILARSTKEDLDWWGTPFIHLGGAGTHYPRRDASGNLIPVRNGWTVRQIGPREKKTHRLENTEDGRSEELNGVELDGFDGEWFDSHDVQGYLEEKYACRLDPKSSFAQCLVDEEDEAPASLPEGYHSTVRRASGESSALGLSPTITNSSTNSSASISPPNNTYKLPDTTAFGLDIPFHNSPTRDYPSDMAKLNYDLSFDQTLDLDLASGFDYGFGGHSVFAGVDLGLDMMAETVESLPVVKQKRKRLACVDVSRLLDEIIKSGICLGRAPGYRRKGVDMAVQKALIWGE
ncbi:hypothetical protein BDW02DRAFT_505845 [Decorospora gaudefroyi]|uniref:BZIP domain-containing protein n=1 Tax=Decorospora gaudefroyi TaxID=184978 RepID=A0A6A5K0P2_9PLEO|nr:hypothetical protein BDW02DRAFT_505845 [Decorospora gaudefroyi]